MISSSSLLAQRINREAKAHHTSDRAGLTILAALFVPVVLALVYGIFRVLSSILQDCTTRTYSSPSMSGYSYQVCRNPANALLLPIAIGSLVFVLWYLYKRVGIEGPLKRSLLVATLFSIAFTAEFFGGAMLILTGVGGIVYLCLVPVVIGWLSVWYNKHLREKLPEDTPYDQPNSNAPQPPQSTITTPSS